MSESRSIKVLLPDGETKECSIEIFTTPELKLILSGIDLEQKEFIGRDLFSALVALRKLLEKEGMRLLCAGARSDVYPSGMSRSMGGGRNAYVTRIGQPSRRNDLIDIFDYAEPEMVGSVEQQTAFHKKWADSLGNET